MFDISRLKTKTTLFTAIMLLSVGFVAGAGADRLSTNSSGIVGETAAGPDGSDLAPLFKAWQLLDDNFAPTTTTTPVTTQGKMWGAIQGLAQSYGDPYTIFLPPAEKTIFETQVKGDFGGVGMEIGIKGGVLTVIAPLKNTPAYAAGIKSGDKILKIDSTDSNNLSSDKAVGLIRGPVGTTVKLLLQRDDQKPFEVTVTRATINLPTIDTELRSDSVFVIKLYSFNSLSPDLFRKAIAEFSKSGSNKLIIDLRGNPGGFLEAAVDMASWFLPVGTPVVIEDFGGKAEEQVYRSRGYNVFTDQLKLAILIDQGSASASEIFAGALHDLHKATLIGVKSFGKGSVQQLFDVTSDSTLKVTVARWLTPNRISISKSGITPDIEVSISDADLKAKKDPQMEKAAEYLKKL